MSDSNKKDSAHPVKKLFESNMLTIGQKLFIALGIVLTLCAIGIFIWLIVQASQASSTRGIVMASSFVLFAIGILYYALMKPFAPRRAWIFIYIAIPIAVAAFVVSLYLDGGASAPLEQQDAAIERMHSMEMQPTADPE